MPSRAPERIVFALDVLKVKPGDRLLEIGCGAGVAVDLVCERLGHGQILAIDRSAKAIAGAARRSARHVESGRARLENTSLTDLAAAEAAFNKVFAINVNVFWIAPTAELQVVRRLLSPRGRLYLFYEPPSRDRLHHVAGACARLLQDAGYRIVDVVRPKTASRPLLAIVAADTLSPH